MEEFACEFCDELLLPHEECDCILEDWEDDYDGQPDELTEWMDFDPDC